MLFSKTELVAAVSALVDLDNEKACRYGQTVENMARFRVRNPDAWLGHELEVLNPLVELAQVNPVGFEGLQDLVDTKRLARGAAAVWPDKSEHRFDKVDYQRILMQERRRRTGRAVEIENLQRPEKDRLMGTKRLDFENRTIARWGDELRGIVEDARKESGGSLSRERHRQLRDEFWTSIDRKLDEQEQQVRRKKIG